MLWRGQCMAAMTVLIKPAMTTVLGNTSGAPVAESAVTTEFEGKLECIEYMCTWIKVHTQALT
jgi:thiazole synthase ThiGH ThiG subunit